MSFARAEILPRATVPVFFGAASFDPRLDLAALVERIAEAGFCRHLELPDRDPDRRRLPAVPGERRPRIRARARSCCRCAKARGLVTLAYAHTREEAVAAARRGVDIVNIDLGWNKGGVLRRRYRSSASRRPR